MINHTEELEAAVSAQIPEGAARLAQLRDVALSEPTQGRFTTQQYISVFERIDNHKPFFYAADDAAIYHRYIFPSYRPAGYGHGARHLVSFAKEIEHIDTPAWFNAWLDKNYRYPLEALTCYRLTGFDGKIYEVAHYVERDAQETVWHNPRTGETAEGVSVN